MLFASAKTSDKGPGDLDPGLWDDRSQLAVTRTEVHGNVGVTPAPPAPGVLDVRTCNLALTANTSKVWHLPLGTSRVNKVIWWLKKGDEEHKAAPLFRTLKIIFEKHKQTQIPIWASWGSSWR